MKDVKSSGLKKEEVGDLKRSQNVVTVVKFCWKNIIDNSHLDDEKEMEAFYEVIHMESQFLCFKNKMAHYNTKKSYDSSVGIALGYGLDDRV
jgi:hypothetical protein